MRPRWSKISAAGICAATSASATSASKSSQQRAPIARLYLVGSDNGFDTAGIFGLGVGYQFNNWFRADVTGEYRGNPSSSAPTVSPTAGGVRHVDTYHATKSEWVVLANAYVDLGTWWCVTPFIGAGVGCARVYDHGFTDQGIASNFGVGPSAGVSPMRDNVSKWNFAWALHAGLAYKVTPNFTVELAYRYLDMGDGLTGRLRTSTAPTTSTTR